MRLPGASDGKSGTIKSLEGTKAWVETMRATEEGLNHQVSNGLHPYSVGLDEKGVDISRNLAECLTTVANIDPVKVFCFPSVVEYMKCKHITPRKLTTQLTYLPTFSTAAHITSIGETLYFMSVFFFEARSLVRSLKRNYCCRT